MRNTKTIHLPDKLHQQIKVAAAKAHTPMEAYVTKILWTSLGSTISEVQR